MSGTPWLSEEELEAWKRVALMQFQLTAQLGRDLAADGLSYQDYSVLAGLTEQPDDTMRISELGRQLGWETSRVSHHITRMAKRGLVARKKCPTDKRGAFVEVTDAGRAAIEGAAPGHVAAVRTYFLDAASPDELRVVSQVARRVLDRLDEGCPSDGAATP